MNFRMCSVYCLLPVSPNWSVKLHVVRIWGNVVIVHWCIKSLEQFLAHYTKKEGKWSRSAVPTLVTPWTVACQASLFMGCPRQEYWSGLPFSFPRDLPNLEIEPGFLALQADSLLSEPLRKPHYINSINICCWTKHCLQAIRCHISGYSLTS